TAIMILAISPSPPFFFFFLSFLVFFELLSASFALDPLEVPSSGAPIADSPSSSTFFFPFLSLFVGFRF
ncbi:hypothetical protein PMAYCL1PPCAC_20146, partial [Pristionchus mayeri]